MTVSAVRWNDPGWDWEPGDHSWLSSRSGTHRTSPDGGHTSVFFIHGGRIREQAHLPVGEFTLSRFQAMLEVRALELDEPRVRVVAEEDGSVGLWVEGTRPPNAEDLERLRVAREQKCNLCGCEYHPEPVTEEEP